MIIEGRSKDSRSEDPVFEEKLAGYIASLLKSQSKPLAIRTIGAVYGQEDSRDHILRAFEDKGIPVILVGGGFHDISLSKKIDRREHVVVSIEPGASEQTLNWVGHALKTAEDNPGPGLVVLVVNREQYADISFIPRLANSACDVDSPLPKQLH